MFLSIFVYDFSFLIQFWTFLILYWPLESSAAHNNSVVQLLKALESASNTRKLLSSANEFAFKTVRAGHMLPKVFREIAATEFRRNRRLPSNCFLDSNIRFFSLRDDPSSMSENWENLLARAVLLVDGEKHNNNKPKPFFSFVPGELYNILSRCCRGISQTELSCF